MAAAGGDVAADNLSDIKRTPSVVDPRRASTLLARPAKKDEPAPTLMDLADPASTWTHEKEGLVKNWSRKCKFYYFMHNEASSHYSNLDSYVGYPAVILSGITSTALFASLGTDESTAWFIQIAAAVITLLSAACGAVYLKLEPGKKSQKHQQAAAIYDSVSTDIEGELVFRREEREGYRWFQNRVAAMMKTIKKNAPNIPVHIRRRYIKEIETQYHENADIEITAPPPASAVACAVAHGGAPAFSILDALTIDPDTDVRNNGGTPGSAEEDSNGAPAGDTHAHTAPDADITDLEIRKEMQRMRMLRGAARERYHLTRLMSSSASMQALPPQ